MEKKEKSFFGLHLMLDLRECDREKLGDHGLVFNILHELPKKIGMTKITQPYVFPYSGLVPEDKGITGVVIIAESHISVHTFQEKDYCFVDVFSCKDFDVEYAVNYLVRAFESKEYDRYVTNRGRDFVKCSQTEKSMVA